MPNSMPSDAQSPQSAFPQPLDRVAIVWILALSLLIGLLLLNGDRTAPRVRDFDWQGKQVGADDTAFILTFNRPMDFESVQQNLKITPGLPGKASWAGRRMAYTLTTPAPYGLEYTVELAGAKDRFGGANRATLQPFKATFRSRDRAFAYIGVQGEEAGRLILFNLRDKQKQILTPPNLVVMEFKPYPLGDRILFAAIERTPQPQGPTEQKLYTVTTGIQVQPPQSLDGDTVPPGSKEPIGQIKEVLDNAEYQNLKFDLSADGRVIVVQRANRKALGDFGPWLLREGEAPRPLKGEPGGEFLITPDSQSLAIAQGQGLAILPLQPDAKPLDFLPKFGTVLSFSRDGSLAAMVKFNSDRTKSLFLVSNQGTQKELFRTQGRFLSAQFDPTRKRLYCLLTELVVDTEKLYQEDPYLAVIDLETAKLMPLVKMPKQWDVQMSLSPDGLGLIFDQTIEAGAASNSNVRDSSGRTISASRLWLLPIDPTNPTAEPKLEPLPMPGLAPRWLP